MELQNVDRQIKKIEVTAEHVKQSSRRDYNPREWDRTVDRYASYSECRFFYDEEKNEHFAIYVAVNIRFMQVISYGSMLSNSGFQNGFIGDVYITFYRYRDNLSIENNTSNRKVLAENTVKNKNLFYYN